MLNKISAFIRKYQMINPGDRVVCAVSGGADSVALLWALYLLRDSLGFTLCAAHFNHGLRADESDRDQQFVEALCSGYDIELTVQKQVVTAGKKGLEAAAREARYRFLQAIPGKIATAHTADDNAETMVMHLLRGTGLKGLGGINPVRGNIIRPMLSVTREEVLAFLQSYHLTWVEDSSNQTDAFLRNRIRHQVMPLLRQENPKVAENLSRSALSLRQDEMFIESFMTAELPDVPALREMPQSLRRRYLVRFMQQSGIREPETDQITQMENLVFTENPSAVSRFSGGICIGREYDQLKIMTEISALPEQQLPCPGHICVNSVQVFCKISSEPVLETNRFTVFVQGSIRVRSRQAGDKLRLHGGTKSLKELFIDRKIPASQRDSIPVLVDDQGVLAVYGIGANLDRTEGTGQMVEITFQ